MGAMLIEDRKVTVVISLINVSLDRSAKRLPIPTYAKTVLGHTR